MDASIEKIKSVKPHPNADRLDLVQVLGYQCVTEKGLYQEGDVIVYVRTDTILPEEGWSEGYRKYAPNRVKAVQLRGEWSEGIIVPLELISHRFDMLHYKEDEFFGNLLGDDVSDILNIKHYEPPIPQDLSALRPLPFDIPKTDELRWEEIGDELPFGELVDVTLKIDGQSATFFYNRETEEFGVTGRSLQFKPDTVNNYTVNAEKLGIKEKLIDYCNKHEVSLALRGESYGSGIQGREKNPHSKEDLGFAMFSVYNIGERKYEEKNSPHYFMKVALELEIPIVPIIEQEVELTQELIDKYSVGIKKIDGNFFEGVVIKHASGSFKIINKNYDSSK